MTPQSLSLMDILVPPPNRWLMSLGRRRSDLPPCVRVVRFSEETDEAVDTAEPVAALGNRESAPSAHTAHR